MGNQKKDENWLDIDKQDSLEGLNNDNGKNDFVILKFLNVVLVVMIIFVGMNRFVFSRGSSFNIRKDNLAQLGIEYYLENYKDLIEDEEEINALIRNFGCHEEIHIFQGEKMVMRLVYYRGKIYELR